VQGIIATLNKIKVEMIPTERSTNFTAQIAVSNLLVLKEEISKKLAIWVQKYENS
jgi:hypothetical protein